MERHSIKITTKLRLMKALVWPMTTYGCESLTIKKRDEERMEAFEMKCIRMILGVSWTQKKTNEWVLEVAGVERDLFNLIKRRKLSYFGHVMRKGDCLEKRSCKALFREHGKNGLRCLVSNCLLTNVGLYLKAWMNYLCLCKLHVYACTRAHGTN